MRRYLLQATVLLAALLPTVVGVATPAASAAAPHQLIQGSGSTWASDAVDQWIADVHQQGLQVVYSSTGSAQGRQDFANDTDDFTVTDLPYQGVDPATGANDSPNGRQFGYAPLLGGGMAFPYHLVFGGHMVDGLRLSGATLAGIFTGAITNWDDPQVTRDNGGNGLPSLPIIPVIHTEGSAVSYRVSEYFGHEYPGVWTHTASAYFPSAGAATKPENGSAGVMNYLTSAGANGAIGMDEYSYALSARYPVAKLLNKAGYYTLPGPYNVAIALRGAANDASTGPDLTGTYDNTDNRAYPLSYFSSTIIPTAAADPTMTTAKRQTLVDYADYALCQGQAESSRIGDAPLPLNLVRSAFGVLQQLHDADAAVDTSSATASSCTNPTFTATDPPVDRLDTLAPAPRACDRDGATPCGTVQSAPGPDVPRVDLSGGRHVRGGSLDHLVGRVTRDGKAYPGSTVTLYASTNGKDRRAVGHARTDSGGRVHFAPRVWRDTRFILEATYSYEQSGSAGGGITSSSDLVVTAYYGVTATASRTRPHVGQTVTISGAITPSHRGDRVMLQRLEHGRWTTIGTARETLEHGRRGSYVGYAAHFRPGRRGSVRLRVRHASTAGHAAGSSTRLTLHVR